jgi:hypothetical protein
VGQEEGSVPAAFSHSSFPQTGLFAEKASAIEISNNQLGKSLRVAPLNLPGHYLLVEHHGAVVWSHDRELQDCSLKRLARRISWGVLSRRIGHCHENGGEPMS